MFWKSKLEKALESEISFLRSENKELRLQLIAMSDKSREYWNTKLAVKKDVPKTAADIISKIENHDQGKVISPEQLKKKQQAIRLVKKTYAGC